MSFIHIIEIFSAFKRDFSTLENVLHELANTPKQSGKVYTKFFIESEILRNVSKILTCVSYRSKRDYVSFRKYVKVSSTF